MTANLQGANEKEKVFVVLTKSLIVRLDSEANKKTMSRSLLIRQACEKYLRELEAEAA